MFATQFFFFFEVANGFNPLTHLNLLSIHSNIFVSKAATSKANGIKTLHKEGKETIVGYIFARSDSHLKGRQSYIEEGMTLIKSLK